MSKTKKRTDNRYQKNLVVGKKQDGSYIRKAVYAKTKRELDQKVAELTQQLNNGIQIWENDISFQQLADIWLHQYNFDAADSWKYNQGNLVKKHLIPNIGSFRICDLKQLHLQTIITSMYKQGYATATMKHVKQIATNIMKVAVGSDMIVKNPFSDVRVPVKDPMVRRALTSDEVALITETWRGHRMGLMAMIMLYAGLRRGEAMALEWQDIDFNNRIIKVTKACRSLKNETIIKKPKSKAGIRDIPIPNVLLKVLMERREATGFVCTSAEGEMLTETAYARGWNSYRNYLNICAGGQNANGRYIKRIQVIDNITAHMLRHTYATMLFDADVDVKSAQKFLGHADLEVTLEIYTHLSRFKEDKAINSLNAHLDAMISSMEHQGSVKEKTNADVQDLDRRIPSNLSVCL